MIVTLQHFSGEYDQEIGRAPIFTSTTFLEGISDEYEVDTLKIILRHKETGSLKYVHTAEVTTSSNTKTN